MLLCSYRIDLFCFLGGFFLFEWLQVFVEFVYFYHCFTPFPIISIIKPFKGHLYDTKGHMTCFHGIRLHSSPFLKPFPCFSVSQQAAFETQCKQKKRRGGRLQVLLKEWEKKKKDFWRQNFNQSDTRQPCLSIHVCPHYLIFIIFF